MTRKTQMRIVVMLIVLSSVSSLLSQGQSIPINESPSPARTYHLLREDDDCSFLADPAERQDFWDPINYIPLRPARHDGFLSMARAPAETWNRFGSDNAGHQPCTYGN